MSVQVTTQPDFFQDASSELDRLNDELAENLDTQAFSNLIDWLNDRFGAQMSGFWDVCNVRIERLNQLFEQASEKEKAEAAAARQKEMLQLYNPQDIHSSLQTVIKGCSITQQYQSFMDRIVTCPEVGPFFHRYRMPENVVNGLVGLCFRDMQNSMEWLNAHALQFKSHIELLQSMSNGKGIKQGLGVAAAVGGGILAGPLGAVGGAWLAKALMNQSGRIDESLAAVHNSFEQFCEAYFHWMEGVQLRVIYLYYSLYGGMILRVQADLACLGKRLSDLNMAAATCGYYLSFELQDDLFSWARETLSHLKKLEAEERWDELANTADLAMRSMIADPLKLNAAPDDGGTTYVVLFARLRGQALLRIGNELWDGKEYEEACKIYLHIFNGANVAWEEVDVVMEPHSHLFLAGLRLAIYFSRDFNPSNREQSKALMTLPSFYAQAITRFNSADLNCVCVSENIVQMTEKAARVVGEFGRLHKVNIDFWENFPKSMKHEGKPKGWSILLADKFSKKDANNIWELLKEEDKEMLERSAFSKWLENLSDRYYKKLGAIGLAVILPLLGIGGYFLVSWLL